MKTGWSRMRGLKRGVLAGGLLLALSSTAAWACTFQGNTVSGTVTGGGADLAEVFVDVEGDHQVAAPGQAIEQVGEEGVPAVGADVVGGLGEQLRRGRHGGAVDAGRPERGRLPGGRGGRRSGRIAALRWRPVTATTSFNSRCFSARLARR